MSNFRENIQIWSCVEFEKISDSLNMNTLCIILKLVIRRFLTCYYFREILRSRDFINAFLIFAKHINFHKMAKFKYFAKQMAYWKFPDRMPLLKRYIARPYSTSHNLIIRKLQKMEGDAFSFFTGDHN